VKPFDEELEQRAVFPDELLTNSVYRRRNVGSVALDVLEQTARPLPELGHLAQGYMGAAVTLRRRPVMAIDERAEPKLRLLEGSRDGLGLFVHELRAQLDG
jgi:hypothetical protein